MTPNIPGNQANTAYELPHAGLFPWENNIVNPFSQRKTIVVGMDDTSPLGQVYVWVGDKQTTGNVVERAGLTKKSANDTLYVVKVSSLTPDATGATNEDRAFALSGTFSLVNLGDVSGLTLGRPGDADRHRGRHAIPPSRRRSVGSEQSCRLLLRHDRPVRSGQGQRRHDRWAAAVCIVCASRISLDLSSAAILLRCSTAPKPATCTTT